MKKTAALLVALLYLSTALGIGLNFHYCFGELTSVKLYQNNPSCKKIKVTRLPDCCKSKQITLKVKDSHQAIQHQFSAKAFAFTLPAWQFVKLNSAVPLLALNVKVNRGPPGGLITTCPLFIKNCTFRI